MKNRVDEIIFGWRLVTYALQLSIAPVALVVEYDVTTIASMGWEVGGAIKLEIKKEKVVLGFIAELKRFEAVTWILVLSPAHWRAEFTFYV